MAIPTPKVEVGFDLVESGIGPFFVLDDSVAGVLDNTQYFLGGTIFYDITDRVRNVSVSRGKSRRFANFQSASTRIELNNHDRAFDPLYPDSPFFGNIVPRREVRVFSDDQIVFTGFIDDWDLSYTPDGNSIVTASANDGLTILAKQTLSLGTPTQELSGTRITNILDQVSWGEARDIDDGLSLMGTQEIAENTNALTYLQKVTETERGLFFINKTGDIRFVEGVNAVIPDELVDFNDTTGIPFQNIEVIYGSELLYNRAVISNVGGGTATATSQTSIDTYGQRSLEITNLLGATDEQSVDYALNIVEQYAQPEYRIEQIEVALHDIEPAQVDQVLAIELGDLARISFTPNGIGDPIARFGEVIRIDHNVRVDRHFVTFGFREQTQVAFILNDETFGKLDSNNILGKTDQAWTLGDAIKGRLSAGMTLS